MRLSIEHTTSFTYDLPISEAYTEMRLKPLDAGGQHCMSFVLSTEPRGEVMLYADRFGNDVRHFDVLQPHQQLRVSASSLVVTSKAFEDDTWALPPLDEFDYRTPSRFAPLSGSLLALAEGSAVAGDPRATAVALMGVVHNSLAYVKGVTDVKTDAAQVLELGRGVCQDFAHVMIAVCRAQGIAVRYVSGYLYTVQSGEASTNGSSSDNASTSGNGASPKSHLRPLDGVAVSNAASHAWVDVFIPGEGWLSLDPTHNGMQTERYVRVAVGRDYADVSPTRGVYRGSAQEELEVDVMVAAV